MSMLQNLLDPQRRQNAAEDQARLKEKMGHRLARDAAEASYYYGLARERQALVHLAGRNIDDASSLPLLTQLAEGLALQGRFDEAVELLPAGDRRALYEAKQRALQNIDIQQCDHPARASINNLEQDTQLAADRVFNGTRTIQFTRCLICGSISAYA